MELSSYSATGMMSDLARFDSYLGHVSEIIRQAAAVAEIELPSITSTRRDLTPRPSAEELARLTEESLLPLSQRPEERQRTYALAIRVEVPPAGLDRLVGAIYNELEIIEDAEFGSAMICRLRPDRATHIEFQPFAGLYCSVAVMPA